MRSNRRLGLYEEIPNNPREAAGMIVFAYLEGGSIDV
jgi:hypothetical protein